MQVLKKKSPPPLDDSIVEAYEQVKKRMAGTPHKVDGKMLVKFRTESFEGLEYAPARLEVLAALHLIVTGKIKGPTAARLAGLSKSRIAQILHRRDRHLKQTAYQRTQLTQSESLVITAVVAEKDRNINILLNPHYTFTPNHNFATQVGLREVFLAVEERIKESPEDWAVIVGRDKQSVVKAVGFKSLVHPPHCSKHWALFAFDNDFAYNEIVRRRMDLALQEVVERSYLINVLAPLCTPKEVHHDHTPI